MQSRAWRLACSSAEARTPPKEVTAGNLPHTARCTAMALELRPLSTAEDEQAEPLVEVLPTGRVDFVDVALTLAAGFGFVLVR